MSQLEKDFNQLVEAHDELKQKYTLLLEKYVQALEEKNSFKQTAGLLMAAHKP